MALIVTNGCKYIMYRGNQTKKTYDPSEAYQFADVEEAIQGMEQAPAKTEHYYVYDTDTEQIVWRWYRSNWKKCMQSCNGFISKEEFQRCKRKNFTKNQRMQIYHKTAGHCYLCGSFVPYEQFEVEHKIPLTAGGSNDISNLYCSCHDCNNMKGSIAPKDLMQKIKQIQLHQIMIKHGKSSMQYILTNLILNRLD